MSSSIPQPCASWPAWWSSAIALAVVLVGCERDQVEIDDREGDEGSDFGRKALMNAVSELSETPRSPRAYRKFALRVEEIRPLFNHRIEQLAELRLTTMALGPLQAEYGKPWEEQVDSLALQVWPTALLVEPEQGESPEDYLERICLGDLAVDCKHVVPQYWPPMIGAKVWRDFGDRAHEAVGDCDMCENDPTYAKTLRDFDQHNADIATLINAIEGEAHPSRWPMAPAQTDAYAGEPVLSLRRKGRLYFQGEELQGEWRSLLRAADDGDAIAVHLYPNATVGRARAVVRDLLSLGYRDISLVARTDAYPYERRLVAVARSGKPVATRLKDSDSVALLVHTLGRGDAK